MLALMLNEKLDYQKDDCSVFLYKSNFTTFVCYVLNILCANISTLLSCYNFILINIFN